MTLDEFFQWIDDLSRKAPNLGSWVSTLPSDTVDEWFAEVFERIELRDAVQVNREIRDGTHDLDGFKRDRLCSVFIRRCGELAYQRSERDEERNFVRRRKARGGNPLSTVADDAAMGPAFRDLVRRIRHWKETNGEKRIPQEVIEQLAKQSLAEMPDDAPEDLPNYQCPLCRDTGWVSTTIDNKVHMAGCHCVRGAERCNQWTENKPRAPKLGRIEEAFE